MIPLRNSDCGLRIEMKSADRSMTAEAMKLRTKKFTLRCVRLAESLPKSLGGRMVAGQLVRCGGSVGANYRAACRARSRAEFISKLGIVEEECDESAFWMEIVMEGKMQPLRLVQPLSQEALELLKIVVKSIQTARSNRASSENPKSAIRIPR
jgi:four helix bundle protein